MTQEELISLLYTVAFHARDAMMLAGCRGGAVYQARSKAPKVGDLVILFGSMGPNSDNIGWLRGVEEHESPYETVYDIEHLDGRRVRWANVRLHGAIPAGKLFGDLMNNPDEVFQPEVPR